MLPGLREALGAVKGPAKFKVLLINDPGQLLLKRVNSLGPDESCMAVECWNNVYNGKQFDGRTAHPSLDQAMDSWPYSKHAMARRGLRG